MRYLVARSLGQVNGRRIAVSGGADDTVRVWDLATMKQTGDPLTGHDQAVYSVMVTQVNGRSVIVSGGEDHTVRVWDLITREWSEAPWPATNAREPRPQPIRKAQRGRLKTSSIY